LNPNSELCVRFCAKRKTAHQNGSEKKKKKKKNTMSKFENVLKAQKVRNNLVFSDNAFVCKELCKELLLFLSLYLCVHSHIPFSFII